MRCFSFCVWEVDFSRAQSSRRYVSRSTAEISFKAKYRGFWGSLISSVIMRSARDMIKGPYTWCFKVMMVRMYLDFVYQSVSAF